MEHIKTKTIDITVIFDTTTLQKNNGGDSPDQPTDIDHDDVYMVARSTIVADGQATADLSINAQVNDTIRWRAKSLSGNTDQAVIIYKIDKFRGIQVTSEPIPQISYPPTPICDPDNPTSYTSVNSQADIYLTCDVLEKGTEGYRIWFCIVDRDRDTGQQSTIGYYRWNPTINVVG